MQTTKVKHMVIDVKHGGRVTDDKKERTTDGREIGAPIISTEIPDIIKSAMEGDGNNNDNDNDQGDMRESSEREDEDELFIEEDDQYNDTNQKLASHVLIHLHAPVELADPKLTATHVISSNCRNNKRSFVLRDGRGR